MGGLIILSGESFKVHKHGLKLIHQNQKGEIKLKLAEWLNAEGHEQGRKATGQMGNEFVSSSGAGVALW